MRLRSGERSVADFEPCVAGIALGFTHSLAYVVARYEGIKVAAIAHRLGYGGIFRAVVGYAERALSLGRVTDIRVWPSMRRMSREVTMPLFHITAMICEPVALMR